MFGAGSGSTYSVNYTPQSLTQSQKVQARENIGIEFDLNTAIAQPDPPAFVRFDASQSLTSTQKTQALTNIGAYAKPTTGIPASDLASGVIPDVSGKEDTTNKVTSLSSSSTNTQYPSAKVVYDEIYPTVETTQPVGGFLPNKVYDLGELTGTVTFTLATPTNANIANPYH